MDFVAVDVETANADLASISQIGIVSFCNGELAESWGSLVNPEDEFNAINVSIHGIDERRVRDSPRWPDIWPAVASRIHGRIVVSHTPFDRHAVEQACNRSNWTLCECDWLDSARVVRMAWPEFSMSGYGLSNLATHFGIKYRPHDAIEDARCAGLLIIRAVAETGVTPERWLTRMSQPISHEPSHAHADRYIFPPPAKRDGNPDGVLFGEILVFTGSLSISRSAAADVAAAAGCRVDDGVTKHTTMLVVGDQDLRLLNGHDKSSKHIKAEMLIKKGQPIRILGETDFMRIASQAGVLAHA